MIVLYICRVSLERVNQGPEALLVHLDLLDLELATAKYVFTSDSLFCQHLSFPHVVVVIFLFLFQ